MAKGRTKKVQRYTAEFKLKAVKLSQLPGVLVKDVAEALDIHPFMLGRWRDIVLGREQTERTLRQRIDALL